MKISGICFILAFLILTSCGESKKSDTPRGNDKLPNTVLQETRRADKRYDEATIKRLHKAATSVLEYRQQTEGTDPVASIEMDRWFWEFKAVVPDINPVEDGSWIDFYPDLTYEAGNIEGVHDKGRYHFSLESNLVIMVSNDDRVKPLEFEAKIAGPTMVLQGKDTYGDNAFQGKLAMDNVDALSKAKQ